ncbi:GAF and ANTAR domain-containing protein [Pedococcus sp. KACC 23699]|uniref:GAF and ANTAR domain-containing protein n=1 Tax=Pedococcus sp. KACC 23699 TaxID=3149228 RepID=A0AAU7JXW7_9MICO
MVEMLSEWTGNCVRLLDIDAAGLLLADGRGVLHLMAASSERIRHLEAFQLQKVQGPCLDCFNSGEPVVVPDLRAEAHRWPAFVEAAEAAGFASVHALPMTLRDRVLGSVGLFGYSVGRLDPDDLALAQAMVHVAGVAIVNEKAASDRDLVNTQLQEALTSRILLEQAKGVLANEGGLAMNDAFTVLRRYARDHGRTLTSVAEQVVNRSMRGQDLLEYARSAAILP